MGINSTAQEAIEGQIKELRNVPKKWNIPPAFRFDFMTDIYKIVNINIFIYHFQFGICKLFHGQKFKVDRFEKQAKTIY